MGEYHVQYCNGSDDITGQIYARQDATDVRIWHETGDLVTGVTVDGVGYWYGTDDNGTDFGGSRSEALDFVGTSWTRLTGNVLLD